MLELFSYDFMLRALAAGLILAIVAPLLGSFFVVRGYSLMADTLAHVALAGVAVGLLFKISPLLSALLFSVAAALGMEHLRQAKKGMGEAVLAIFLSGSLALAVTILSAVRGTGVNLMSFLFGSITTITPRELLFISIMGGAVIVLTLLFYKELLFVSFDEELAESSGIPTRLINCLLVGLGALTVTLAIPAVGALLIGALLSVPMLTALQLKRGFRQTLLAAIGFSLASVVIGLSGSYYLNVSSGGAIVLTAILFFGIALSLRRLLP